MPLPRDRAHELVQSLALQQQPAAMEVLVALIDWSEQRSDLLAFFDEPRDQPYVRVDTLDGRTVWLARPTEGGDAKVEVLTRTIHDLPFVVRAHLHRRLQPYLSSEKVLQMPMTRLGSPPALSVLLSALDFALGAIVEARTP